jgi:hypothetical protein
LVDDLVVGLEDDGGELVPAKIFPDVFDRIEFCLIGGSGTSVMFSGPLSAAFL